MRIVLLMQFCTLLLSAQAQFNYKATQKSLMKVTDLLYACDHELSNGEYKEFRNALMNIGDFSSLKTTEPDSVRWNDRSAYNGPYVLHYHRHPAYSKYPAVNLSYEAAVKYCSWLTEEYNKHPKRKFKKVLFKLPTESEWELAAQAGNSQSNYPWKEEGYTNMDGNILCNFNLQKESTDTSSNALNSDAYITAPVNTYWPNNFGIYNMSGNVAEMLEEKGTTKGGSWIDGPEAIKIKSKAKFDGKGKPYIGFRYFMVVIEKE